MSGTYPSGVTRQDIEDAIRAFDEGVVHEFDDSTDYDILLRDGRRYPPKAISGIAARRVAGRILKPKDFSSGEGSKCFTTLRENGFEIVPKGETTTTNDGGNWTTDELKAAVEAYVEMLRMENAGKAYSKADFNRQLRAKAIKRSKGSVEYRMANISAVLQEIGHAWINGYKPQRNVGDNVKNQILELFEKASHSSLENYLPTADNAEVEKRTRALLAGPKLPKPSGSEHPKSTSRTSQQYERSPAVRAFVLQEAAGVCELCRKRAPFLDDDGMGFLEVHHVITLAQGGPDTVENAAALCPNCHRCVHFSSERIEATKRLYVQVQRLTR